MAGLTPRPLPDRNLSGWRLRRRLPEAARGCGSLPARLPQVYPDRPNDQRSGCAMASRTAVTAKITTGS
jgi:hypothetical protein